MSRYHIPTRREVLVFEAKRTIVKSVKNLIGAAVCAALVGGPLLAYIWNMKP